MAWTVTHLQVCHQYKHARKEVDDHHGLIGKDEAVDVTKPAGGQQASMLRRDSFVDCTKKHSLTHGVSGNLTRSSKCPYAGC